VDLGDEFNSQSGRNDHEGLTSDLGFARKMGQTPYRLLLAASEPTRHRGAFPFYGQSERLETSIS
jgi:hypothetical protein